MKRVLAAAILLSFTAGAATFEQRANSRPRSSAFRMIPLMQESYDRTSAPVENPAMASLLAHQGCQSSTSAICTWSTQRLISSV